MCHLADFSKSLAIRSKWPWSVRENQCFLGVTLQVRGLGVQDYLTLMPCIGPEKFRQSSLPQQRNTFWNKVGRGKGVCKDRHPLKEPQNLFPFYVQWLSEVNVEGFQRIKSSAPFLANINKDNVHA